MTTRRTFLKGIGAGLLLPSTWDSFANHFENYGEPLLRRPDSVRHVLYATCWAEDFQLSLNRVDEDYPCPNMPIRKFIAEHADGDDPGCWETDNYDEPIGVWFVEDIWPYHYSADARAFYFLSGIDLGSLRDSNEAESGYIDFVEGPCPGNDSRLVCADGLGISLLQERLIAYGYETLIKLS
jgi:hypothetical protein